MSADHLLLTKIKDEITGEKKEREKEEREREKERKRKKEGKK